MSASESSKDLPKHGLNALTLGALGVVFGDIGTSPLYTLRECLSHLPQMDREAGVLGILSLMFWSLFFEVTVKYLFFVTRADNRGEGGIFALLALSHKRKGNVAKRGLTFGTLCVLAGAALLYGDGVITPAISVLGAAEGFSSFNPALSRFVVPIACVILAGLFLIQSRGTTVIGKIFGPVMLVWFAVLAGLGISHLFEAPRVLLALNPLLGIKLLWHYPGAASELLGAVVLTFTGAEALYADLGHFGRPAIARAWSFIACPALVLSYFGQGAMVIANPDFQGNPFFALAPAGAPQLLLVTISIAAAIIASQALISGTFSLTRQAIQLGFFPRLKINHTSAALAGQIYIPLINTMLALASIWVVITFGSSAKLASAYGIAVTGTMLVTAFAFYFVAIRHWQWPVWRALLLCSAFCVFDATYFAANLPKIVEGGWFPMAMGAIVLAVMHTWKSGRDEIQDKVYTGATTELELSSIARSKNIVRVPGSAVFMVATPKGTPLALLHHLRANKCLQHTAVLLTITTEEVPHVDDAERLTVEELGEGVWRAIGRYGYMESPDVTALVDRVKAGGVPINPQATTYYFNREMILSGGSARMWEWQKSLYAFLSRNARPVKDYYRIQPTQIIEIGLPVQL